MKKRFLELAREFADSTPDKRRAGLFMLGAAADMLDRERAHLRHALHSIAELADPAHPDWPEALPPENALSVIKQIARDAHNRELDLDNRPATNGETK